MLRMISLALNCLSDPSNNTKIKKIAVNALTGLFSFLKNIKYKVEDKI